MMSWLLWWKIDKNELQKQIEKYETLKFHESARGISILCLLISILITFIFIIINNNYSGLIDIFILLILCIFIYKGRKWSFIVAMIFWTLEKFYQIYNLSLNNNSSNFILPIIWWAIFMHPFYLGFITELKRYKLIKKESL